MTTIPHLIAACVLSIQGELDDNILSLSQVQEQFINGTKYYDACDDNGCRDVCYKEVKARVGEWRTVVKPEPIQNGKGEKDRNFWRTIVKPYQKPERQEQRFRPTIIEP